MPPRSAALLVGIDDYSVYDASIGAAPGTSNLKGARNDVRAWYAVARSLGIPAENIIVRTSPPMSAADMSVDATGTDFGPATRNALLEAVATLGQRLAGEGPAQGLLTWGGHGGVDASGAVLCPADTTGANLQNAISYASLAQVLDAHLPPDALTVFMDVCHATAVTAGLASMLRQPRRSLGAAPGAAPITLPRLREQDRVIAACRAYQSSYEHHFMGLQHGAFSWAIVNVLERWGIQEQDGVRFFGLDHLELTRRAAALLHSAAFPQLPLYEGPAADANVPVFWPGDQGTPSTSGPAETDGREIDPGSSLGYADTVYQINALGNGGALLGYVVVTGPNDVTIGNNTWSKQRQYWVWTSGAPFPSAGWVLQVYGQTPPTTIAPSQAYVFPSAPFPTTIGSATVSSGHWHKIRRGQSGSWADVGWLKVKHQNSVPNDNHWYELVPSGQGAAPWFTLTTSAPLLEFQSEISLPPDGTIPNCAYEPETVLQVPS